MPYRIAPSDKLIIDVFGFEDLANREILVDSAGRISVPLAGSLDAAGLSPADLEAALVARLRQAHVRDPKVSVNVKEATSQTIAIDGQVRKPGIYPAAGVSTLMRAVARAEGTDEFSRLEEVVVFRTVAGQRYAALYNLDAIRHGTYSDPELYANDLVMVGENRSRRLFADLLTVTSALSTPLIIALDRLGN